MLTGEGFQYQGKDTDTYTKVTKYTKSGQAISLPSLNTGRYYHTCGKVTKIGGETVRHDMDHDHE